MTEQPTVETRTVQFTIDPALRAYFAWLDAEGLTFAPGEFDVFAAGYRAREAEDAGRRRAGHGRPRAALTEEEER
jgi:hypothetical protein